MLTPEQEERWNSKGFDLLPIGADAWNLKKNTQTKPSEVKAHLAEELSLQLSEIIQIAEGLKYEPGLLGLNNTNTGYNKALSDLISTLTRLKEKK